MDSSKPCLTKRDNTTFLETYNCQSKFFVQNRPKAAQYRCKQIYRPDYVLYHFVHYSPVTKNTIRTQRGISAEAEKRKASVTLELNDMTQGVKFHTKTVVPRDARESKFVGFPCPRDVANSTRSGTTSKLDRSECNCYVNEKVESHWVQKLEAAIRARSG